MYYREYCKTVHDRKGFMVPEDALPQLTGYCSVYGFDSAAANEILAIGESKGFKRFAVHSKRLVIDLDDGEESIGKVVQGLKDQDLSFVVFSSGGKGYHVFVDCEEAFRPDLPALHQILALRIAPTCDRSLYRHSSLIRLPGTVHEKTGNLKKVVQRHKGTKLLELPPLDIAPAIELVKGDRTAIFMYYQTLADSVNYVIHSGARHNKLWQIAKDAFDAGISYEQALADMSRVNSMFDPPKPDEDVERVLNAQYRNS